MSPRWMTQLLRARQSQEDVASQRLAFARTAQQRAHQTVLVHSGRVDALGEGLSTEVTGGEASAFVAAAVALQAAAATYANASGEAARADTWVSEREGDMTQAARDRHVAQELNDRADAAQRLEQARVERRITDETAASGHDRRRRAAEGELQ